ncbi:hypothetical protein Tco_0483485 [Tanacetum coccineum]
MFPQKRDLRSQLIDSIGSILHEYLSPEIWNLPLEQSNVVTGDNKDSIFSMIMQCCIRQWQKLQRLQKLEACSLPIQVEACHKHVKYELSNLERKIMNRVDNGDHSSLEDDADKYKEQLEVIFFKLKESKSYILMVGSISISCITAATLLLNSLKQTACLIALDIVEDGIVALTEWKNPINRSQEPGSLHSSAVQCLQRMSQRLEMTAEISGNKKSASAFKSIIKKVSGIVIRIACSGVGGLRDASVNTLRGLASIDTDLIWLLLADVYYYKNKGAISSPPPVEDLPPLF